MKTSKAIQTLRDEGTQAMRQVNYLTKMLEQQDPSAPGTKILVQTIQHRMRLLEINAVACMVLIRHLMTPNRVAN